MADFVEELKNAARFKAIHIREICGKLGVPESALEYYGNLITKVDANFINGLKPNPNSHYVVVTGITPTPLGEGKTVTTIASSMALNKLGKKAVCCLRQSSVGPLFGIKGGATGGGAAQVLPAFDVNIHFTGDLHAVTQSHDLLTAFVFNSYYQDNPLKINPLAIYWRRVLDMNDRSLRKINFAINDAGLEAESGFDITACSEVLAVLGLAGNYGELRDKLGNITIAATTDWKQVTARDVKCDGAMAMLMQKALMPNVVQTTENSPAIIHGGPFANISYGSNTIISDRLGLATADYAISESGFGSDLGFEKFVDIKCAALGRNPCATILVCSVRAVKFHSGRYGNAKKYDRQGLQAPHPGAVKEGAANLRKHIANVRKIGVPVVVVVNRFPTDSNEEIKILSSLAAESGADAVAVSTAYSDGGNGALEVGAALMKICDRPDHSHSTPVKRFYSPDLSLRDKIQKIATDVYGASGVSLSEPAEKKLELYEKWGFGKLPVCIAKTSYSLSDETIKLSVPVGFTFRVRDAVLCSGAGYVVAICGNINTMPGLPKVPEGTKFTIDDRGNFQMR